MNREKSGETSPLIITNHKDTRSEDPEPDSSLP